MKIFYCCCCKFVISTRKGGINFLAGISWFSSLQRFSLDIHTCDKLFKRKIKFLPFITHFIICAIFPHFLRNVKFFIYFSVISNIRCFSVIWRHARNLRYVRVMKDEWLNLNVRKTFLYLLRWKKFLLNSLHMKANKVGKFVGSK